MLVDPFFRSEKGSGLSKSKEDKHISIVDGSLRIKNPANKLEAELGTDLLLRYALTRRGLALDQANILEFSLHDAWVEKLMEVKHTSSPQGYAAVQYNQLLNADRRLFTKLAELTRAGIQVDGAGRPLDGVFPNATEHPEVQLLLQPLPAPPVAAVHKPDRDSPYRRQPSGKGKKLRAKAATRCLLSCEILEFPQHLKAMHCALVIH